MLACYKGFWASTLGLGEIFNVNIMARKLVFQCKIIHALQIYLFLYFLATVYTF